MATIPIKGEGLVLYIYDGAAYRPIACLTSNSLKETRSIIETQTKCDPGVTIKNTGPHSYELSCEGLYIDTTSVGAEVTKASHDYLRSLMASGVSFTWKQDTGLTDTVAYFGTAYLTDLEGSFGAGDENATFSATLNGSGAILTADPN